MSIAKGQTAPNFKLFNQDKKEIEMTELKGKNVVLLFFPFAFSGTCTKELCNVRDNIAVYNGLDAVVLGISTDSAFTLAAYKKDLGLNFDLVSDFNKTASEAYGSLYNTFILGTKGVSKRSAFVVDKNGIVRYAEVLENASEIPNFDNINATLQALK
jgi:glutaredoxin-dependent peroxiredoxin